MRARSRSRCSLALSVDNSVIRVCSQPNRVVSEATSASFQGRTPAGKASEAMRLS